MENGQSSSEVPQKERRKAERRHYDRRKSDRKGIGSFLLKLLVILLIGGVFAFLYYMQTGEEKAASSVTASPVRVMYPERGDLEKTLKISGYVESEATVTVLPKISGTLEELSVDLGDDVSEGMVIARVDSEQYELNLKQAEAAYLAAKSTYERAKELFESNVSSKQEYDQAKSQYDAAKSQYDLAKLQLRYTEIEAPMNGVVLKKHSAEGTLLAPEVPIVTIGDLDNLRVKVHVNENLYGFFLDNKDEMVLRAEVPALKKRSLPAKIKTLSPYISAEAKNFEVLCTVSGTNDGLRPGMFVFLTFVLEERRDCYYLPHMSLSADNSLWIYTPEDNRAKQISYNPDFQTDEHFEVSSDYADNAVIIEGQHFLKDGQQVKVLNEEVLKNRK